MVHMRRPQSGYGFMDTIGYFYQGVYFSFGLPVVPKLDSWVCVTHALVIYWPMGLHWDHTPGCPLLYNLTTGPFSLTPHLLKVKTVSGCTGLGTDILPCVRLTVSHLLSSSAVFASCYWIQRTWTQHGVAKEENPESSQHYGMYSEYNI